MCKASFQVGMDLYNVQKQSRDENMEEDYATSHHGEVDLAGL